VRLLICAGGTGGGVYPALAVLEAFRAEHPDSEILWVGGEGGMEETLVKRMGIPSRPFRGRRAWRWSACPAGQPR